MIRETPPLCICCGELIAPDTPQHIHHLCTRVLAPAVIVPLHDGCHATVHRRLRAHGVELRGIGDAPPHEQARAVIFGVAVLLEAAAPAGAERACLRRAVARLDDRLAAGADADADLRHGALR